MRVASLVTCEVTWSSCDLGNRQTQTADAQWGGERLFRLGRALYRLPFGPLTALPPLCRLPRAVASFRALHDTFGRSKTMTLFPREHGGAAQGVGTPGNEGPIV